MPTEAQIAGGHKANLNNPNTSQDSKEHSKQVLDNEFNGGDVPKSGNGGDDGDKNPGNVAGGLKAAINNPKVSEDAKQSAKERLNDMQGA
ncbi:conidiation-specific protein 6 [Daldinia decipiens]|uniref:conidiation-specific protein 6 n=1 Tax=Daldinia decipiens TaxID=326647 RepID=UPI0020C54235|nr:conidiation-specific protein 6 [Daldinia decipiens]KAI1662601.1 conidiation-specific protein 6 [Daldinia decipiens]